MRVEPGRCCKEDDGQGHAMALSRDQPVAR
jgi:hypothetical protein